MGRTSRPLPASTATGAARRGASGARRGRGARRAPGGGAGRARGGRVGRLEWAVSLRPPGMLQIAQGRPMLGPNSMRSTDVALRAIDDVGLTEDEMLAAVVTLSSFVSGIAKTTVEAMQAADRTGISDEEWWDIQGEY